MAGHEKEPPDTSEKPAAQTEKTSRCNCRRVSCYTLISVFVGVLAVYGGGIAHYYWEEQAFQDEMLRHGIGEEGVSLFKAYDRNADGYLSLAEFEPLVERLIGTENGTSHFYDEEIDPASEVIFIASEFQPLQLETMTIEMTQWTYNRPDSPVSGLRNWQSTNLDVAPFGVNPFVAFLPEVDMAVGQPYNIITSNLNIFTSTLSSNRFYPPRVSGKGILIHRLLTMFHPRPFVHTRFGPQGSVALIRAENEHYVSIVFRIHAEFQLNEPPQHPFWFSPAMFTGELVIRRDSSHIVSFHMYVPTNKSLNVDMEWLNSPSEAENMEVDIGFLPQMELKSSGPSIPVTVKSESGELINILESEEPLEIPTSHVDNTNLKWNTQIDFTEAFEILERQMYPFKKVSYLPFLEACKQAAVENKLVHLILLWGALDDQSC